jgi:signal transduction histidine kinase/CheY-like chemotaxis protein
VSEESEQRLLVCAPTGRDAPLTCALLAKAGLASATCASIPELCARIEEEGAAGVLLAEETIDSAALGRLTTLLDRQPAWSDLPILVFSSPETTRRRVTARVVAQLGNVTLIDRPVRPITMLSAAHAAVRARRRQYALRRELAARELAVRRRDEFLAMLGHELRNPLSAILMALDVLEARPEETAKYRSVLRRQSKHLARLVDDLLDVSRVTSGKILLQKSRTDLADLVRRCATSLEGASRSQDVHVDVATPSRPVLVSGDPVRLEQVVVNLVSNALKYTPRGGHVGIAVATEAGQATLAVEDDGVGVAPDVLPRIFDLFAQAPETLDRARGGLGIGLTLVRSLVELHGGTVAAASEGVGRGARFTVRLPLETADASSPARENAPVGRAAVAHDVLVVEDHADSREALRALIEELGHHVDVARDGLEAIERAGAAQVLVVDIGLPGMDGYEVARRVRAERGGSVYLIALTGYGQPEDRRRALEAGFDRHFTKPVDIGALGRELAHEDLRGSHG